MRPATLAWTLSPWVGLGALALVGLVAHGEGPSPHGREDGCPSCHVVEGETQDTGRLRAPEDVNARCLSCHPTADMHPVGMAPSRAKVPSAMPLNTEGQVTCATCHAEPAHAGHHGPASVADLPAPWFRGGPYASTTTFCQQCHPADGPGALARVSPHTIPASAKDIRDASCSACHSGMPVPGSAPADAHLRLEPAAACLTCHPGMPHHGAATHLARPVPQGTSLVLAEGRIACFTCHDVHRHGPTGTAGGPLAEHLRASARSHEWASVPAGAVYPGDDPGGAMLRLPLEGDALCADCHRGHAP